MQGACRCSLCRARRYRCCGPYPYPYPCPNPNPALTPTPTLHQVLRLPTAGKLYGMFGLGMGLTRTLTLTLTLALALTLTRYCQHIPILASRTVHQDECGSG